MPVPKKFHLDKRAHRLLEHGGGADDELLTTKQLADWFEVSVPWLDNGRSQGYGPEFVIMGGKIIRYTRAACRKYLKQRTFARVADYKAAKRKGALVA